VTGYEEGKMKASFVAARAALAAAGFLAVPAVATSGTATLAPGEAQQIWIGPAARLLTVCNDTASKGTVTVTIDSRRSEVLPPGICTEDSGSSIDLANDRSGPALIVYRSQVEPTFPGG
jgi:hypothetical protein